MGNEGDRSVRWEIDPSASTDTDEQTIELLRAENERLRSEMGEREFLECKVNAHLDGMHPSQLPSRFFRTGWWGCWSTTHGIWKSRDSSFSAIRRGGVSRSTIHPEYFGAKRVMEFHTHDGTKTDWIMVQYSLVDRFIIGDEMVLCKIFKQKGKAPVSSGDAAAQRQAFCSKIPGPLAEYPETFFEDLDNDLINFDPTEDYINLLSTGREDQLNSHISSFEALVNNVNQHRADKVRKRLRSNSDGKSEVWKHFTKIHTKDPDVVYAACHYCDRMLKAHPKKDGTSHLRRHSERCQCKMHMHQPSQVLWHSVDEGKGTDCALMPTLEGNQQGQINSVQAKRM